MAGLPLLKRKKMTNIFALLLMATITVIPTAYSFAAPPAKTPEKATERVVERVFSEAERAIIEEFFTAGKTKSDDKKSGRGKDKKGLPPGLAKKDRLPPGLEKQLQKNGKLPPGLVRNDLPLSLQNKLYPPRVGTRRYLVGRDVVLIDTKTDIILDIIRDVVHTATR